MGSTAALGLSLACATDGPRGRATAPPALTPASVLCEDASLTDEDFCLPVDTLARVARNVELEILHVGVATGGTSRPNFTYLARRPEGDVEVVVRAKWAPAPSGGDGFNNSPRREIAAFRIQELFLESDEYVVPFTQGYCIPLEQHAAKIGDRAPTFPGTGCVYGAFAYWLQNVTPEAARDFARAEQDEVYRRALANLNLFTYLIGHRDSRDGNFLVSTDPDRPRVVSIDNDLAFKGFKNPGVYFFLMKDWSKIQVPALPGDAIERLRRVTRADLDRLMVIEHWEVRDGLLVDVPPGEPLSTRGGVHFDGQTLQIGLYRDEVDGIDRRIRELLARVDAGEIATF